MVDILSDFVIRVSPLYLLLVILGPLLFFYVKNWYGFAFQIILAILYFPAYRFIIWTDTYIILYIFNILYFIATIFAIIQCIMKWKNKKQEDHPNG